MPTVIITGSSRGIGKECAVLFAQKGYNVVICYNNSENEARKLQEELNRCGNNSVCVKLDVSSTESIEGAFKTAYDTFGSIDVLVNNAGVSQIKLLSDVTDDELYEVINTNLIGTIKCSREATRYMVREHKGSIINVSSMWGISGASCESVYSATKGGVITFTKALSKELGPSGIRVNCVAPGVIDTDMNKCLPDDIRETLSDSASLCRIGEPREVAEAVYFLASESASFITGQTLSVDGGFN